MENLATIGHNKAPTDKEIISEQMWEKYSNLLADAQALGSEEPRPVTNDAESGEVSDIIKEINAAARGVEDARKVEKDPYFQKGKLIDEFFADYRDTLTAVKAAVQKPLDAYLNAKAMAERKRQQEEAERLRKEAEEQAALAALQEKAKLSETAEKTLEGAVELQVQAAQTERAAEAAKPHELASASGLNSTAGLRTSWVGEIGDIRIIDLEALRPYFALDAVQKALNGYIKAGGRDCKGAKIFAQSKAVIR